MTVWCVGCRGRVLLWPGDLRGIVNTDAGAVVAYRCGAGHTGNTLVERCVPAPAVTRRGSSPIRKARAASGQRSSKWSGSTRA